MAQFHDKRTGTIHDMPAQTALEHIETLKNSHSGIDQLVGHSLDVAHGDNLRGESASLEREMENKIRHNARLQPDSPIYEHSGIGRFLIAGGGTK